MTRPERYFIGPSMKNKLTGLIARDEATSLGGGGIEIPVRNQQLQRPPLRNLFYRLSGPLSNCGEAQAVLVTFNTFSECGPEFVDTEEDPVTVKDIGNIVRTHRFAMEQDPNEPIPADTVVECDYQKPDGEGEDDFRRVVRIVDCDCSSSSSSSSYYSSSSSGSSSSSYSSSSSGSSSNLSDSGSPPPPPSGSGQPPCENIEVVTGVSCVDGVLTVTKTTICAVIGE